MIERITEPAPSRTRVCLLRGGIYAEAGELADAEPPEEQLCPNCQMLPPSPPEEPEPL